MENKTVVLALDKVYRASGQRSVGEAFTALSPKGKEPIWLALDIEYGLNEDGSVNTKDVLRFEPVTLEVWKGLPIRFYDLSIGTPRGPMRVPGVIVSQSFSDTVFRDAKLSNDNIMKRDNYTCQYTGKKMAKEDLNIDHVIPRARGGQNTWENMVASCKKVNSKKDNRTPAEAGLKLIRQPFKPSPQLATNINPDDLKHIDWALFLK